MVLDQDEFLHSSEAVNEFQERMHFNFYDKKNKTMGALDLFFSVEKNLVQVVWNISINKKKYSYSAETKYPQQDNIKFFGDEQIVLEVLKPHELFLLKINDGDIEAKIEFNALAPSYKFPKNIVLADGSKRTWFDYYQQRCAVSGVVKEKNESITLSCLGQRSHSWGNINQEDITFAAYSNVLFKEFSLNLLVIYFKESSFTHGYISRKSGNLPVVDVEPELLNFSADQKKLNGIEFFYTDSQDDRDLVVSKKTVEVDFSSILQKPNQLRFRNFSEFTIIGTNKKGVGLEEVMVFENVLPTYIKKFS